MVDKKIETLKRLGIPVWHQSPWQGLIKKMKNCRQCTLHQHRTQAVLGTGNKKSSIIIVGEAPGKEEDEMGVPFVGKAGKLLDLILKNMFAWTREDIYISNILKSRPPENRNPTKEEIEACTPYLLKEIELIKPKIILTLGLFATQYLLQSHASITELRGKVQPSALIPSLMVLPTYHPAYLLRTPSKKKLVMQDMLTLKEWLQKHS